MRPFAIFQLNYSFSEFIKSITDGRTDRPTDRTSYGDARTHLKTGNSPNTLYFIIEMRGRNLNERDD